jgi:hypothetical protein
MDKFFGLRRLLLLNVFVFLILGCEWILIPPGAHADANSYLGYLQSHGTFAGSPASALHMGMFVCDSLHAGMTLDQVVTGHVTVFDVRSIADAAQRELCPDTLGH